jgi:dTDP-4-amino-4,6-dideoxygalactose transaminase
VSEPIPQTSPGAGVQERRAEYEEAISGVLGSGRYILGPAVERFEREFAAYLGSGHCVGVASGTDAIELALRGLGVGRGDAVLTVSHTAVATVAAIVRIGAVPVLVDIDETTYTMDPKDLERTLLQLPAGLVPRAVVPVHLYGAMADMPAILSVARASGLVVVEDCAQAHGAELGGRKAGTFGDAAAFSFYPTKNLAALGDGGAVVTSDSAAAAANRELREYGWRERYVSERHGVNSRLDELQAAILLVGLRHLDEDNARRRSIAAVYDRLLRAKGIILPSALRDGTHVYHQYVIRTPGRDLVRRRCEAGGIATGIHYPVAVHQQPAFADGSIVAASLPVTERVAREIVSLPMYPQLSEAAAERAAQAIAAA